MKILNLNSGKALDINKPAGVKENTQEKAPDKIDLSAPVSQLLKQSAEDQTKEPSAEDLKKLVYGEVKIDKKEMAARYTNDMLLHLVISDFPCLLDITANLAPIPASLSGIVKAADTLNLATTACCFAADTREIIGTFKNPKATKLDKTVDTLHFIASDAIGLGTDMLPLFMSMANPIVKGIFIGGQALGVVSDVAKTVYDIKRKGQQSVH